MSLETSYDVTAAHGHMVYLCKVACSSHAHHTLSRSKSPAGAVDHWGQRWTGRHFYTGDSRWLFMHRLFRTSRRGSTIA
jgi:hypothetical protein